jgi:molybdopterin-guanine dinucleotide biosynthesis protein A
MISLARSVAEEIYISGAPERYGAFGVPCIADHYERAGPLGGIASLLRHLQRPRLLILACDLPFVTPELLSWLWRQSLDQEGWTVPEDDRGRLQCTCAVYAASLLPYIEAALGRGTFAIAAALAETPRRIISAGALAAEGFGQHVFRNLNFREDYLDARFGSLQP